jgi:WD40 repeat protein
MTLCKIASTLWPFSLDNDDCCVFSREALRSKFQVTLSEFTMGLLSAYLQRPDARLIAAIINDKIQIQVNRNRPLAHQPIVTLPSYDSSKKQGINAAYDLPNIQWGVPGSGPHIDKLPMFGGMQEYFHTAMPATKTDRTYITWIDRILKPKLLLGEELPGSGLSKISHNAEVANPLEPTIAFASVMNAYEGMLCMNISPDARQIATGYHDSSIRVYRSDPSNPSSQSTSSKSKAPTFGKALMKYAGARSLTMNTTLPVIPNHTPTVDSDEYPSISENGVLELHGHSSAVCAVDQDSSSRLVVSASFDEYVRLWDTHVAQCVGKYHVESPIWDVKFHPMSYYFAAATMANSIHVFSIDRKAPVRMLMGHTRDVNVCHWHDNLALMASGSDDKTACLWDIRSPSGPVRIFRGSQASISSVKCSPFGNQLAAGTELGVIHLWDIGTAKTLALMPSSATQPHAAKAVDQLAFNATSEVLSAGYGDCSIRIYNLHPLRATMKAIASASSHLEAPAFDELVLQPSHQYHTKFTPIYHLHYTNKSLLIAGGPFSLEKASGHTSLDTSLAGANEKEAVTALGLSHPVPASK